ncbi:MAG: prefoldin subunit beta [Candidatus Thermoplasmatota archaeon]|nr:prefoldin subunit beta [Candidatus Thermoplasmatota archaeon]
MRDIPPQLQNQINQFRQLQQQLQVTTAQRVQMETRLREVELTLEELEKAEDDAPIYKSIGSLLIRAKDREEVLKELQDQKETLGIRVKTLQKQEKTLADRYERMQQQITQALGGTGLETGVGAG